MGSAGLFHSSMRCNAAQERHVQSKKLPKLTLNKETVRTLSPNELNKVVGGLMRLSHHTGVCTCTCKCTG
jgi:natural product precursor